MTPRYKQIADYPGSDYEVGEIIVGTSEGFIKWFEKARLNKYPHLFRRLEWWEERKFEELPQYIRHIKNGGIYQVRSNGTQWDAFLLVLRECVPATLEEYEQYMKEVNQ